ncbi:MAG: CCA tRNA nucleotidyltransferase [Pseudomonadota bacterium]
MKLDAPWLSEAGPRTVMEILAQAGHQAFFVGGCVRNTVLGAPVSDIDIATSALPDEVAELAQAAQIKAVPTGIAHGTLTLVAAEKSVEVTTFRKDVETDGRRAVVAFSDQILEDAMRRDFTMNALYADTNGYVRDPTGLGIADLEARVLRFIGAPEDRIREDYLRILRFFRFHAWYAAPGFDADALAAVAEMSAGLETISRERIGQEMRKLLLARSASSALATMGHCGVLVHILPGADPSTETLLEAVEQQAGAAPDWLRRLAALGGEDTAAHLRLSKTDARDLEVLRHGIGSGIAPAALGYKFGQGLGRDIVLLRAAMLGSPFNPRDIADVATGAAAEFPVRANDLMPRYQGPELGRKLAELEAMWIGSNFSMTRDDLLA